MNCWNFLNKIYCITLNHRTDRRLFSERQFRKVGLFDRVEYITVEQHPTNSECGIYQSHMRCIQKGLESDAQLIAVFEDDVIFDNFDPHRINQSFQFLQKGVDWEVLFLGCLVSCSQPTLSPMVRKIRYRSLAHAYVVQRRFAEKLLKIKWSGIPFDVMLQNFVRHAYMTRPAIAFQSNARSDNHRRARLDLFRRLCGGLYFIQKMNECYHCNFKYFFLFHLLVALVIVGLLIWITH